VQDAAVETDQVVKPFDPGLYDPRSIDAAVLRLAKRRQFRERVSMIFAGVFVTAMVATFYRILVY
jgi:hypothetical protein